MPALIGYLIALVVLLGGGYAGLEWLAAPDEPVAHQHQKVAASANGKQAELRKSVPSADPAIKAEDGTPNKAIDISKTPEAGTTVRDESRTADAGAGAVKPAAQERDAVPPGGCTPIGLTAGGQMVFPLQCRDFLAAKRNAPDPAFAGGKPASPNQDVTQVIAAQPKAAGDDVVAAPSKPEAPEPRSAPTSEPASSQQDAASHDAESANALAAKDVAQNEPARQEAKPGPAPSPSNATPATKPTKVVAQRSLAELRLPKPERSRSAPDRSRLVKMTLLTIEFPDGHRERRLVPYRRLRSYAPDEVYDGFE